MIRWFTVACALVCVACLGCGGGSSVGSVSGQVTMDGSPLPNALVTFVPEAGGRAATGKTDAGGKYELIFLDKKGALVGKHKVSVTSVQEAKPVTEMSSDSPEYKKQAMGGSASDYAKATVAEPIPARYNSKTTLSYEVKPGTNVINLELTSK